MGATILSLDSTGKEGPPTHHGGLHSLIGFSENEGLPTHHGSIHPLIGFNEKGIIFNRVRIGFSLIYNGIPMEMFIGTLSKCQTRNLQLDFERGGPVGKRCSRP